MPYSPIAGCKVCFQQAAWHRAWGRGKVVGIRELSGLRGSNHYLAVSALFGYQLTRDLVLPNLVGLL